ncbi:hypothetical protein TNCV_2155731 [Trichonephila clavipes]|nr:hypothetical protein TNCV_2155731 [Trichonephila clavipes]
MRGSNDTEKCQLSETSASAHLSGHLPWEIPSLRETSHSTGDVHLVTSHVLLANALAKSSKILIDFDLRCTLSYTRTFDDASRNFEPRTIGDEPPNFVPPSNDEDILSNAYFTKLPHHANINAFSLDRAAVAQWSSCPVIYSQFGLAIHQNDHQARRRFVEWAQNEIAVVPDFHKRILFRDEAHFWLNGYVNKQNCRIWSEANPQVYVETPLHPEKLTVWCALWAGGILLQKQGRLQRYSQW